MIKLLLMLLGGKSMKLMFLHRTCGTSRTLARDEQEALLTEVRQSPARRLKSRVAALFPCPMAFEDYPMVGRAWDVISLAL